MHVREDGCGGGHFAGNVETSEVGELKGTDSVDVELQAAVGDDGIGAGDEIVEVPDAEVEGARRGHAIKFGGLGIGIVVSVGVACEKEAAGGETVEGAGVNETTEE